MPNNLKKMREKSGLTLRELADKVVPPASFSMIQKLEKSNKRLSESWKRRLSNVLECHPDDLDAEEPKEIPVVGFVGAGAKVYSIDDHHQGAGFDDTTFPSHLNPRKAIALEVRGDSMQPLIRDGFLLFYEDRIFGVPEEFLGKICVVQLVDDSTYVKIIRKGTHLGRYNLESLNPTEDTIQNAEVKWSAFVKAMIQK